MFSEGWSPKSSTSRETCSRSESMASGARYRGNKLPMVTKECPMHFLAPGFRPNRGLLFSSTWGILLPIKLATVTISYSSTGTRMAPITWVSTKMTRKTSTTLSLLHHCRLGNLETLCWSMETQGARYVTWSPWRYAWNTEACCWWTHLQIDTGIIHSRHVRQLWDLVWTLPFADCMYCQVVSDHRWDVNWMSLLFSHLQFLSLWNCC